MLSQTVKVEEKTSLNLKTCDGHILLNKLKKSAEKPTTLYLCIRLLTWCGFEFDRYRLIGIGILKTDTDSWRLIHTDANSYQFILYRYQYRVSVEL